MRVITRFVWMWVTPGSDPTAPAERGHRRSSGTRYDTMVSQIREHLGSVQASTEDGIEATGSPMATTGVEKRVG